MSDDVLKQRVEELLAETDPEKRGALSRRLRSEIGDLLKKDDLEKLSRRGIDFEMLRRALRMIK